MEEEQRQAPADAVQVTDDGVLQKLVLQEGTGELPPLHARCLVHYVGYLASSGEVFMDTRKESQNEEPTTLVAGRDSSYQEVGLNLAVAGMRRGEKARIWAGPKYGYGEKGSFSFPTVPPNADLVYDLELLDFEPPNEDEDNQAGMTFEARMEAAERRRQDGNALFRQEQYSQALGKYRLALSYLNEDMLIQLGDYHMDIAMKLKRPVLLNIAAAQLHQEDYHGAISTCSEVLAEDKQNAKALFRRGRARHLLGQSEAALKDLVAARQAESQDAAIAKELAAVRKELKEEREASKKVFKAYFDKAKDKADEPLYDDPPSPPLTPEPSLAEGLGTRLQTLSAPLAHSSTLRWVLGAAAVTVAACWLLPHIR